MPLNKKSFMRYRVIDACLRDRMHRYPSKEYMIERCEEKLDCNVSVSTFEKDIYAMKNLSEPGYYAPIEYSKLRNGYYYSDENYSISNFKLKDEDIDAIEFAASILQQYKALPILEKYSSAIDKIMDVVNVRKLLSARQFHQYIQLDKAWPIKGNEYLEFIVQSIKERQVVHVRYKTFYSNQITDHLVHPYLLKEYKSRWYIVGMQEKYKDIIVLCLDRIISIEPAKGMAYKGSDFNAHEYYKNTIGVTVNKGKPQKIVLELPPDQAQYLITQPIHDSQKIIKSSEKTVRIELCLVPNWELKSVILSYGESMKVISPKSFQKEITETIEMSLNQYKS